jgi:acyl-CoA reductase-like NAD-dependent aldehyde dehydrogenase
MRFDPNAGQIFRSNRWTSIAGATIRDVINPADLSKAGAIIATPPALIEEIAAEALEAQRKWKRIDTKTRALLLHDIATSVRAGPLDDIAKLMTLEMGKPYPEALGEIANVPGAFHYFAEMARDDAGKIAGTTQAGSFQFARYEPYGVSVHIVPFNFPILLMCWTVAASLAAGNACIIKPAEATSLSTLAFMEHFSKILPPGLVSCVTGGADVGQALIKSHNTHAVAFTGSVKAAKAVAVSCAELMKPCIVEAGGNDPMIISEHAPLDVAVAGSVTAAFHLSGQVCTSSERFFVHEKIHDVFVGRFAEAARKLRVGPGLEKSEIGPLVSEAARSKIARLVDDAKGQGARIVCGGRIPPNRNVGWYYEPTILTGCTPDMAIMREEIFGPVAAICKVRSFDEALTLANDSDFGLGASVFTSDLGEAMEAAERLEAGMVWVNNPLIDNDALPFGGRKLSGLGRELGRQGLDAFRQTKMVVLDHKPEIQGWWYPYPDDRFYKS